MAKLPPSTTVYLAQTVFPNARDVGLGTQEGGQVPGSS